jgi:hypothetical protein
VLGIRGKLVVQTASSLSRIRESFSAHAHNPHGMHTRTSVVVLEIDAARTLASDNNGALRHT